MGGLVEEVHATRRAPQSSDSSNGEVIVIWNCHRATSPEGQLAVVDWLPPEPDDTLVLKVSAMLEVTLGDTVTPKNDTLAPIVVLIELV